MKISVEHDGGAEELSGPNKDLFELTKSVLDVVNASNAGEKVKMLAVITALNAMARAVGMPEEVLISGVRLGNDIVEGGKMRREYQQ